MVSDDPSFPYFVAEAHHYESPNNAMMYEELTSDDFGTDEEIRGHGSYILFYSVGLSYVEFVIQQFLNLHKDKPETILFDVIIKANSSNFIECALDFYGTQGLDFGPERYTTEQQNEQHIENIALAAFPVPFDLEHIEDYSSSYAHRFDDENNNDYLLHLSFPLIDGKFSQHVAKVYRLSKAS